MSLYHMIFLAILIGAILEYRQNKTNKLFYFCVFFAMTCMLCFRYGQGTDYFSYERMYLSTPPRLIETILNQGLHGEVGWKTICVLLQCLKVPFWGLILLFSVAEMLLLYRFIERHCTRRFMALLLAYHTLYLTYFFSALRQGLAIAVFIGLALDWLMEKKYVHYLIGCIFCISMHTASAALLILPLIHTKLFDKLKWHVILVGAAWAVGAVFATGIFSSLMSRILPASVMPYFDRDAISIIPIMERIATYVVVLAGCWLYTREVGELSPTMKLILRVVTVGMIAYGGLLWMPMVASRMAYIFKVTEIALLCSVAIRLPKKYRQLVMLYVLALTSAMYVKNIASYIYQGQYKSYVNVMNFPYVSIFDQKLLRVFRYVY